MQLKDSKLFHQQCYIDGSWSDAGNRATIDVINPATRQKLGTVPNMGAAETRRAIEAARADCIPGLGAEDGQRTCRDPETLA